MPPSTWHSELRRALVRRRLPQDYRERLMGELLDHFYDLMEENPHMDARTLTSRLGWPDDLARAASAEYRRRTFAGRHPIVTFLVAPVPTVATLIVGLLLLLFGVAWLVPDKWIHSSRGVAITPIVLFAIAWTLRLAPFAVAALLFTRGAARSGCDFRWSMAATALVVLFAGAFNVWFEAPTLVPESGRFGLGFALPTGPVQLLQASVPLAIALWYTRRANRPDSQAA
jgi:hypothetical protein